jgi:hypothetical protein
MPVTCRRAGAAGAQQRMAKPSNYGAYSVVEQRVIFGALPGTSGMPIAQPLPGPPPHLPQEGPLAAPQILVPEEEIAKARRRLPPAPDYGWYLMGWLGLVFVIVGGCTLVLSWYPTLIGNPQWEFGTVSSTYDNLPITALGLGLLLAAGVARGIRWWTRIAAVVFLLLALIVIGGLVLYATNIPLALRSVTDPLARSGLKRAIVKSLLQGVMYGGVFCILGVSALRHSRALRHRQSTQ